MKKQLLFFFAWCCILFLVIEGYLAVFSALINFFQKKEAIYFNYKMSKATSNEKLNSIVKLKKGECFSFKFFPPTKNLAGLSIQTVTWGNTHQKYLCDWTLKEIDALSYKEVDSGTFFSTAVYDWGYLNIFFKNSFDTSKLYELTISSEFNCEQGLIGIPLFEAMLNKSGLEKSASPQTTLPVSQFIFPRGNVKQ